METPPLLPPIYCNPTHSSSREALIAALFSAKEKEEEEEEKKKTTTAEKAKTQSPPNLVAMDFHTLPRKELQALCKRNRIAANMTNVAMADALRELQLEGGLVELALDTMQEESSRKVRASSVRKGSARRAAAPSVESKEQPASPLPRARRVTVGASEIRRLMSEGEGEEEEEKKEGLVEMTTPMLMVKRSTAKKPAARSTRKGATKKENAETAEEGPLEAAKTPARRTAARRGAEIEDGFLSPSVSTRRTRQSSKSTAVVDLAPSTLRRSTRIRARASVPDEEKEDLVLEPEQVEEGIEIKNFSEKTLDLEKSNVSSSAVDGVTGESCEKDCDFVVADATDAVKADGESVGTIEFEDAIEENVAQEEAEKDSQQEIGGFEKLSDLQEEIGGADRNQDNTMHSNDFEQVSVPRHQLDVDSEVGMIQKIIVPQDQPSADVVEGTTQKIGDCERDFSGVSETTILSQHQLAVDSVEDGMIQETQGFDEQLVEEVEECSEIEQLEKELEECSEEDAIEGMTKETEDCEQVSDDFEEAIHPQHQLAKDANNGKEDGMIQATECLNQLVEEVEECSEVEQETNQAGAAEEVEECSEVEQETNQAGAADEVDEGSEVEQETNQAGAADVVEECSEVEQETNQAGAADVVEECSEVLPMEGLVSSLQNLDITGDAAVRQSQKEDKEVSLDLVPEDCIPAETSNSAFLNQVSAIPEVTESASGLEKSEKEEQASADVSSLEDAAAEEGTKGSPAKSSFDGDDEITSEELKKEESDEDVKSDGSAELAMDGIGCGEMKLEDNAESKSKKNLDVDYSRLSMRQLKTIYKQKKAEGKRFPLAQINDNHQC